MTTTPPPVLEPAPAPSAGPPRRRRVSAAAALVMAVAGVIAGFVAAVVLVRHAPATVAPGGAAAADRYACPMHPTIVQDHPGDCPICGMPLEQAERAPAAAPVDAGARHVIGYRSPMDPLVTSPTPRSDEMGMPYLPIYEDEVGGAVVVMSVRS